MLHRVLNSGGKSSPLPISRGGEEKSSICQEIIFARACSTNVWQTPHRHKGIEGDRGWTLKSVIEDEERMRQEEIKHKKEVGSHLKELYFDIWQLKFENCKTKKQIWKILTLNDKYSPSLSSYYYYHKGLSLEECLNSANSYFNYDNILRVLYVCEIDNPKWNSLGLNDDEIKSFNKQWCSLKEK